MEDVIQVQDQFYILATASKATERTAVLQHDDTFAVFDLYGDVGAFGTSEQGLYHEGTRYVSRFRLRVNGRRPLLLSARVKDDNELFGADLTNPDMRSRPWAAKLTRSRSIRSVSMPTLNGEEESSSWTSTSSPATCLRTGARSRTNVFRSTTAGIPDFLFP